MLDVKLRGGADVVSDHHLVAARMRLKLRRVGSKKHNNPDTTLVDCKIPGPTGALYSEGLGSKAGAHELAR